MKIKHLFFAMAAAVLSFAACNEEEDLGVARLDLSPTTLSVGTALSSQTVTLTATRDWTVQDVPDWIAFDPASGKASTKPQEVAVTVMANPGYNRTAEVTFSIGLDKKYLHVSQAGDKGELDTGNGTLQRPFTASAAYDYVLSLPADQETGPVYIRGIISKVGTTYEASGNYGNASFYISDDGTASGSQFYVFQTYYLGNKKWTSGKPDVKVGDEVIICGNVVNYRGNTPETVNKGGSYVYSLNGVTDGGGGGTPAGEPKGSGTLEDPYNPSGVIAYIKTLAADKDSDKDVYIKGKISEVKEQFSTQYGNASFYITEDGTTDKEAFYVFRTLYLGNRQWKSGDEQVKAGDEVIICGKVINYKGNTPETSGNKNYLYSLNGKTGDTTPTPPAGDPKGTGTLEDPYNPAGANAFIKTLAADTDSDKDVYIKGKISEIKDQFGTQYGNASFYLTEDGSKDKESFYVFRTLYLGNRQWKEGDEQVKAGDEVIICGKVVNYKGNTPETSEKKSYLYSLNGNTGGDNPPTPPTPVDPTDIATIIKAADNTAVAAENVFVGTVSTKGYVASDGKNSIYVYEDKTPTVKKGDIIKFSGTKTTYYDLPEITSPTTVKISDGQASYPEAVDITANFDTYTATEAVYVKYTATMFKNGNYTNFKVEGATKMSGTFSNAPSAYYNGLSEGDKVVIYGFYNGINVNNNLVNVFVEKIENLTTGKTITGETEGGQGGGGGDLTADFTSNVTWTPGTNASEGKATVNGTADVNVLKLGTSSKAGEATITIPAGTKKLSFYGVSWKGNATSLVVLSGGQTLYTQALAANDGAANNSPWTMTVSASDYYTYTLPSAPATDMTVTLTTPADAKPRVILFGIKAEK